MKEFSFLGELSLQPEDNMFTSNTLTVMMLPHSFPHTRFCGVDKH